MSVLAGKKALVIGGSGGIGKELCRLLAGAGASVVVHGRQDSVAFSRFIQELQLISEKSGSQAFISKFVIPFDAAHFPGDWQISLEEKLCETDILCICFGPFLQKSIVDTTMEDWQRMAILNYVLPGYCTSSVLRHMVKMQWGRILLFGGTRTYSLNAFRTNAAYAAIKTAICSLVRSVAYNYAADGITCNALLPGFTDTQYIDENQRKILSEKMPCGKLVSALSVANAGMFLLQSEALNGVLLNVDYGWNPRR